MAEVDAVLKKEGSTLLEILQCSNTAQQFRSGHEGLQERLVNRKAMIEILDILRNSTERSVHKAILSVFQTSNMSLNRFFADDLVVAENAIVKTLEEPNPTAGFAAGTISRIINRSLDTWPDECGELCRVSDTIYVTVIKHINAPVVYQLLVDLMNDNHRYDIGIFMWHCFLALLKKNSAQVGRKPRAAYQERDIEFSFELSNQHKLNIVELLRQYFDMRKGGESDFDEIVASSIADLSADDFLSEMWILAKSLKPSEKLALRAYNDVLKSTDLLLVERALAYLTVCYDVLPLKKLESVILKVMLRSDICNLGMIEWLRVVKNTAEKAEEKVRAQFKNEMTHIIGHLWTRIEYDDMKRAFLMEAGTCVKDAPNGVSVWSLFIGHLDKWGSENADWTEVGFGVDMFDFEKSVDELFVEGLMKC